MNLPDFHPQDDLDNLLRKTLHDRVSKQDPPDHLWRQIKIRLQGSEPAPRRLRLSWPSLATQAAVVLLLAIFGGFTMQSQFLSNGFSSLPTQAQPSSVALIYVNDQAARPPSELFSDEANLRLMKDQTQIPLRSEHSPAVTDYAVERSTPFQISTLRDEAQLRRMKMPGYQPLVQ